MKTALITGCNGGLGKALMKKFAENQYNIIACVFPHSEEFEALCKETENAYGISINQIVFNSTDTQSLCEGIKHISEYKGSIDVLVNNAGISIIKPIFNVEMEDLVKTFQINYFSTVMVTKAMAQELAPFNIRVNAVAAAPMNTDMFKNLTEKTQKKATKVIALKRPAEVEEVARAAYFLTTEDASFITGDILRVDGGAIL